MTIIFKDTKKYSRLSNFSSKLDELNNTTLDELKRELYDCEGYADSELLIIDRNFQHQKKIWQRILYLITFPIFVILIMPIKWLITGNFYFNRNSYFGKLILNILEK